jgi:hypothetical protein
MLFIAIFFTLLWRQTSCYLQPVCYDLTFGKCSIKNYCGITDTGAYNCLPCPAGNLCPGDGYIYHEQQLNNKQINRNLTKYNIILTSHFGRRGYIVSSDPSNGRFLRKKFKRFIKIVKVGLKVAAIAKTGGTAGIAKLAAVRLAKLDYQYYTYSGQKFKWERILYILRNRPLSGQLTSVLKWLKAVLVSH